MSIFKDRDARKTIDALEKRLTQLEWQLKYSGIIQMANVQKFSISCVAMSNIWIKISGENCGQTS
jgi:hypothetical protein